MNDFIKLGDIILITGGICTGKTTFAKCISKNLSKDKNIKTIYIDWIKIGYNELESIYYKNKDMKTIIIIDNYIEIRTRLRFSDLFRYQKNFTLIYIMNHLSHHMLKFADVLFFAKTTIPFHIDAISNKLNMMSIGTKKSYIMNKMNKLNTKGFLYLNKFDKKMNKEYYIKDITNV